jgi:plastocyanin
MRSWFARSAVAGVALAFLVGSAWVARADTIVIEVRNNFFSPREVAIVTGDTVCWVWVEGFHTTTSVDGLWDSDVQGPGTMFEYTFTDPGDFGYICTIHLECCNMVGIVHVVDSLDLSATLGATDIDPNATRAANFTRDPVHATFDVMVESVSSTNAVDVFVNGNFVGTITLDANGNEELSLDSANGDMVPDLQPGDEVEVLDAMDDTTLILVGRL